MGIVFQKLPVGQADDWKTALDRVQGKLIEAFSNVPAAAAPNVVTVTADYAVKGDEDVIHVDAQRGPVKITMLPPSQANRPLTVKQVNLQGSKTAVNQVTIASKDGSATIAGQPSLDLDTTGTGSVAFTADATQHWPATNSGGNPPAAPPGGLVYIGKPPIYVVGNVIYLKEDPAPPPPPPVVPWVAPISFGSQLSGNATGVETWQAETIVDFTGSPSSMTLYWWFQSLSTSGNSIFNVRIGGTSFKALDGAIAATWTETSAIMAERSILTPFSVPLTGLQRVAISAKSSGAGQTAQIQGVNLMFR